MRPDPNIVKKNETQLQVMVLLCFRSSLSRVCVFFLFQMDVQDTEEETCLNLKPVKTTTGRVCIPLFSIEV